MIILLLIASIGAIIYILLRKKPQPDQEPIYNFVDSEFKYTVYKSYKNQKPRSLTLIFAGNRIDDLGYKIYSSYRDKLNVIDVLIKDTESGELMKIVAEGTPECAIGVRHPQKGHIGYLQYKIVNTSY